MGDQMLRFTWLLIEHAAVLRRGTAGVGKGKGAMKAAGSCHIANGALALVSCAMVMCTTLGCARRAPDPGAGGKLQQGQEDVAVTPPHDAKAERSRATVRHVSLSPDGKRAIS